MVVDRVELDGLRVALLRDRDGRHNAADLLDPPAADNGKGVEPLAFASASLAVRNGALTWNDEATGRALALSEFGADQRPPRAQAEGYAELSGRLTQAARARMHGSPSKRPTASVPEGEARSWMACGGAAGPAAGQPMPSSAPASRAWVRGGGCWPTLPKPRSSRRASRSAAASRGPQEGAGVWTVERLSTELDWRTPSGASPAASPAAPAGGVRWPGAGSQRSGGELALSPEAASRSARSPCAATGVSILRAAAAPAGSS